MSLSSRWESALHWLQHRPAAAKGPTIAPKIPFQLFRATALRFQTVVEEQFVTHSKIVAGNNVDATSLVVSLQFGAQE